MTDIYLSNTLTHKKEKFVPIKENFIGIYSCGPTVYWNQHIGNMYAYTQWDILVRFFRYLGYEVKWVMNITDVGHMTSDEDTGEDKMEKGAIREGVSVWKLADKYIAQFKNSMHLLNIVKPDVLPRATEHISDQIELIKLIEKNGLTYHTKMGVVYDTGKFPDYTKFANLDLEKQKSRADVEKDTEKKNPWDFLLWVTGNPKHIMQWDSPWGKGYPGWHIECTAMSTKYLGKNFDIHTGGIEHVGVHHTNEIAQGYGAFGKTTANYWLHNGWLVKKGGEKVSKSTGGLLTVEELAQQGYGPLSFRYLVLNSQYKKGLQFSFEALDNAQQTLDKLKDIISGLKESRSQQSALSPEKLKKVEEYKNKFLAALADDLNTPLALSVFWKMLKSNIPATDKYDLALSFNEVLGLGLSQVSSVKYQVPKEVKRLIEKREELRKQGKFAEADKIRDRIYDLGFTIEDSPEGAIVRPSRQLSK